MLLVIIIFVFSMLISIGRNGLLNYLLSNFSFNILTQCSIWTFLSFHYLINAQSNIRSKTTKELTLKSWKQYLIILQEWKINWFKISLYK